jgi:thiol:disulfide interchange protein DsbD
MKNKVSWLFVFLLAVGLAITESTVYARNKSIESGIATKAHSSQSDSPTATHHVVAKLIANTSNVIPGKPFRLGIQLIMDKGWHTYYKEPGEAGMATKIIWNLPPGFKNEKLLWEKPDKFNDTGITTYGYIDNTLIASEIIPPQQLPVGKKITFTAHVEWLACNELCVPGHADVQLILNTAAADTKDKVALENSEQFGKVNFDGSVSQLDKSSDTGIDVLKNNFDESKGAGNPSFFFYLVFAFLGGIILNFMPCVLPVVAIKVLSLLEQSSKETARTSTIAFASGIFSSFLLLGLIVIGLQSAGHQVGWGFQFQQPIFLMFMASLVLLFSLSLFGLLEISFSFGQKTVNELADKQGLSGDFFKGVLATILSTPCTAPFLGTALGFAFAQPWTTTLTIFAAVGAGMCLPYFILIVSPGYIKFLPKPGVWMEKLKEAFGFVLLATTIWLVNILAGQIDNERLVGFEYFLLILAFVVWLMNRFVNLASAAKRIFIVRSIALLIMLVAGYFCLFNRPIHLSSNDLNNALPATGTEVAEQAQITPTSFSVAQLNEQLNQGKTVFLDFTARWCLTCQVNESTTINTVPIQDKMRALHVVFMKADWTKQDPAITALLKKFGRSGVPLYVIFPAKNPKQPIVLPELITQQIVLDKLDEAGPSQVR